VPWNSISEDREQLIPEADRDQRAFEFFRLQRLRQVALDGVAAQVVQRDVAGIGLLRLRDRERTDRGDPRRIDHVAAGADLHRIVPGALAK
jgi:hypothetical protein